MRPPGAANACAYGQVSQRAIQTDPVFANLETPSATALGPRVPTSSECALP
jgi:hypothetical protein